MANGVLKQDPKPANIVTQIYEIGGLRCGSQIKVPKRNLG
jgi:hypothetical protein